ncbi:MAG: hypothetical protein QOF76_3157 [Solirubrobacteraceae bacterium]|jgi:SAM-dependent methyltransferase|nr:hypothetical protein [Solirubrobacteraceae bacterium]
MSDLRDFYTAGYAESDARTATRLGEWRALGAEGKANHVLALVGPAPRGVVELGCGDGALLAALARRGWRGLTGFELSPTAAALAAGLGVATVEAYDGERVPRDDGAFDLAIVSHVLEHVTDPQALLAEAARVARRVVVEVPLEGNRSARRPAKAAEARAIGHIQAFTRADVAALAAGCGLRVERELSDPLGLRHHAFFAADRPTRAVAAAKWGAKWTAWRLRPLEAERWFTVHYAALLSPRGRSGS